MHLNSMEGHAVSQEEDHDIEETRDDAEPPSPPDGAQQEAFTSGQTEHDSAKVEQSDDAKNTAGQNDQGKDVCTKHSIEQSIF